MVRHATRQQVAETWPDDGICPNVKKWLKVVRKNSRSCQTYYSGPGKYEVVDGRTQFSVSLSNKTCACGLWQISGIPCKHAVRAILVANKDPNKYVSEWYSVRKYKEAYSLCINPIPDSEQWPSFDDIPTLEPPMFKRSIGRPSRNRRREPGEQRKGKRSTTVKCKKCNCFGHNTRTCKGGYTAKEKRQMLCKITKSASTCMEICTQASTSSKGTKRKTTA
ncbi:uncharacterized protein LOC141638038 [Silene latifolia]|uniref:uncharacterized protein LOC141638038 n=1 Tax=Silene latifolia TaxID=37657 RepID=UPI003D77E853